MANDASFRLYLLRHAHAAWPVPGSRDFDRPLDAHGRAEARDITEQALLAGFRPDLVIASPAERCRQTAETFASAFDGLALEYDRDLYANGEAVYLDRIRSHFARPSLMLVGHNPMIETVALQLSEKSDVLAPLIAGYPTAGLLVLDFTRPLDGDVFHAATPVALITPSFT